MIFILLFRRKRATDSDDGFDLLTALGLRKKQPKIESHGLEGISNEHLEQILLAGMADKQPRASQINVNMISKVNDVVYYHSHHLTSSRRIINSL